MTTSSRYLPIRELARGGMGVVSLAEDTETGVQVALKVLLSGHADAEELLRWQREMKLGQKLKHPGIVQVLDAGVSDQGAPWLVMELVPGESLRDKVKREGPLPAEAAVRIGVALVDALQYAHENDVLHRDMKPQNVILRPDGRPVLIDLGLAKILNRDTKATKSLTTEGEILGTPAYMSPEQARGAKKEFGPWTDVYGLGATLYTLVTGRPPFDGSAYAVLKAVETKPPRPPRELRSDVPLAFERVIMKCLAKDPAARFGSAAELKAELKRLVASAGSSRGPVAQAVLLGSQRGKAQQPDLSAPPPPARAEREAAAADRSTVEFQHVLEKPANEDNPVAPARAPTPAVRVPGRAGIGLPELRSLAAYRLKALVAGSSTSSVYSALDPRGGEVAVKILQTGVAEEYALKRWRREMLAGMRLADHPGLARLIDAGVDQETLPWLVMEYVPGPTIRDKVTRDGPRSISVESAAQIGALLADAISFAHGRGVLHRDLRPENVILKPDPDKAGLRDARIDTPLFPAGWPVIVGLGLARVLDSDVNSSRHHSLTGKTLAEPAFLAPEQVRGKKSELGPWTDVYGIGAVVYFLLTGRPPVDTGPAAWDAVLREAPRRPSQLRTEVPEWLDQVVLKCLEKGPALRFQTAEDLAKALDPSGDTIRTARSLARRQWGWGMLLALGTAIGVGLGTLIGVVVGLVGREGKAGRTGPAAVGSEGAGASGATSEPALAAFEVGKAKYEQGDTAGALLHLERALQLDPGFARAYVARACCLEERGDLLGARRDLDRAVELDPRSCPALEARGELRLNQGDLVGAQEDIDRALLLDPSRAVARALRGGLLHSRGDHAGAVREASKAIEGSPDYVGAYVLRAAANEAAGLLRQGVSDAEFAIRLDPKSSVAYALRAGLRDQQGDPVGAMADCNRALELDPSCALAYTRRSGLLFVGATWRARGETSTERSSSTRVRSLRSPTAPGRAGQRAISPGRSRTARGRWR